MGNLGDLQHDLEEFVPHVIAHAATPGFTVALGIGDDVWLGTWGMSDLRTQRPMGQAAVVRTGSMGKIYTATAVLRLVDEGVLDLDAPVSEILPFDVTNPLGERDITLRDLLGHRSGLTSNYAYSSTSRPPPLARHLETVFAERRHDVYGGRFLPMWSAKVGEQFQYTNTGIALAGLVVELVNPDDSTFGEYVRKHVFEPLGMSSTVFEEEPLEAQRPDLAADLTTGYMALAGRHTVSPRLWVGDLPAGASVTRPTDHLRLLQAHFAPEATSGPQILARETRDMALTCVELPSPSASGRGLVWQVWDPNTRHWSFGHGGGHMWGWTNSSRAWPEHKVAMVTCANQWDLAEGPHRPRYVEADLCNDFVTAWLRTDGDVLRTSRQRSWSWKVSYIIGLTMAERVGPRLGAHAITVDQLADVLRDSTLTSMRTWDEDGFRAGIQDLERHVDDDPHQLIEYLTSGGDGPSPVETGLIWRDLGGRTGQPVTAFS